MERKTIQVVFIGSWFALEPIIKKMLDDFRYIEIIKIYTDALPQKKISEALPCEVLILDEISNYCPKKTKDKNVDLISKTIPLHDYLFSVNLLMKLPDIILNLPNYGAINMHSGKLPEYAGIFTYCWAIINGDDFFTSTVHWMNAEIDSGGIIFSEKFEITENDTGFSLLLKSIKYGQKLVLKVLMCLNDSKLLPCIEQNTELRHIYFRKNLLNYTISWSNRADSIVRVFRSIDFGCFSSPVGKLVTKVNGYLITLGKPIITECKYEYEQGKVIFIDNDQVEIACDIQSSIRFNYSFINEKIGRDGVNSLKSCVAGECFLLL